LSICWPITLTVVTASPPRSTSLAPAPGVTPAPAETSPHRFLSDDLIAREVVAPEAMRIALQASLAGRSLTEILVGNGDLSEDDLARTLAVHHRLDHVDLEQFDVDRDAAALIEPDVARRLGAVPIAFLPSGTVVVALYEPNGSTAVVELAKLTARTIQAAVASRSQIETLIESLRRRVITSPASAEHPLRSPRNIVVSSGGQSHQARRPAGLSAAAGAARQPLADQLTMQVEGHIGAARERAELAERRRREAEDRARSAQEQARNAEARARVAEARAQAAEQRIDAAEERAEDATVAIEAANKALARLLHACEVLDRHVGSGGPQQPRIAGAPDRPAAAQADAAGATDAATPATDVAAEVAGEHPQTVATEAPEASGSVVVAPAAQGRGADVEAVSPEGPGVDVAAAGDAPVPDVPGASEGASGAEGDPDEPDHQLHESVGLGGRRRVFGGRRRGG
jgi:hypothetical protein